MLTGLDSQKMASMNVTLVPGTGSTIATWMQSRAAKISSRCAFGRPARAPLSIQAAALGQNRQPASLQRARRRRLSPLAAADEVSMLHETLDTNARMLKVCQ